MGDKFENIKGSVIATRSGVAIKGDSATVVQHNHFSHALNHVGQLYGSEAKQALEKICQYIQETENKDATELFNLLSKEMVKPKPRKSILKAIWSEFKEVIPHVSGIASAVKVISKIFL